MSAATSVSCNRVFPIFLRRVHLQPAGFTELWLEAEHTVIQRERERLHHCFHCCVCFSVLPDVGDRGEACVKALPYMEPVLLQVLEAAKWLRPPSLRLQVLGSDELGRRLTGPDPKLLQVLKRQSRSVMYAMHHTKANSIIPGCGK